jgi:CRISPR-associated protein Csm3
MSLTNGEPVNAGVLKKVSGNEREEALKILRLFGVSGADSDDMEEIGPTRASFADCPLNGASRDMARANNWPLTEVKSENTINRIKGVAEHPRFTERVPAGLGFDFSISIKEMEGDDSMVDFLFQGMKLLELDALGGSGSRGYGRVRFELADDELQSRFDAITPLA